MRRCSYCYHCTNQPVFCGPVCAGLHVQLGRVLIPGVSTDIIDRVTTGAREVGMGVAAAWEMVINRALDAEGARP